MRYMLKRKAKEMGLGRFPDISLIEARKRHLTARLTIANGDDPIEIKRKKSEQERIEATIRFSHVTQNYIRDHNAKWSNAKHASDWQASLTRHAFPFLDKKPFAQLSTSDVLKVLKPIWHTKHETARKVQNRIKLIFGYAKAEGLYEKDNPAIWQDHLCHSFPIFNGVHQVKHHRALDYKYAPSFFAELMAIETMTSKELQFTTLTAARTNETLGATAQEFDLTKRIWRVPAERMKARKTHDVPLSDQACCLLEELFRSHNVHYIFHGRNPGKPFKRDLRSSFALDEGQTYSLWNSGTTISLFFILKISSEKFILIVPLRIRI